jgi:hypothetical protein
LCGKPSKAYHRIRNVMLHQFEDILFFRVMNSFSIILILDNLRFPETLDKTSCSFVGIIAYAFKPWNPRIGRDIIKITSL